MNCIKANLDRMTQAMRLLYGLEMKKNCAPVPIAMHQADNSTMATTPFPSHCQRTPFSNESHCHTHPMRPRPSHLPRDTRRGHSGQLNESTPFNRKAFAEPFQNSLPPGIPSRPLQRPPQMHLQRPPQRPASRSNMQPYQNDHAIQQEFRPNSGGFTNHNHQLLNPYPKNWNAAENKYHMLRPNDDNQSLISDVTDPTFMAGDSKKRTFFWQKEQTIPEANSDENDANFSNSRSCRAFACFK
uniref:Uncharacterized protein n=2 Tax=Corethron hystrix TaxID=216773 RepID=A0A7S1FUI1_9STRA|mmetsp:Transcript_30302/g.69442  ORF Transcript_30302/g.69442 Transcript_30302/m.69442 type:complete len:242 (+) Transcript_30302:140-865(+)